jgi:hypothetical protein
VEGAVGLSVSEMEHLISRFTRASDQLRTSQSGVNTAVNAAWWLGPVATNFRAGWTSTLSPTLLNRSAGRQTRHCGIGARRDAEPSR